MPTPIEQASSHSPQVDLRPLGILHPGKVHANFSSAALIEQAVIRHEGVLTARGAFSALTGEPTGRSPKDKFIVREPEIENHIDWGNVNQPLSPDHFTRLRDRLTAYLEQRDLFVFDGYACADPRYRLALRVITEKAWHCLFARCLFLRPPPSELASFQPEWTVLHACNFHTDPMRDGTRSHIAVVISFLHKLVLICGTHYAGEIKKSIFTVLNALLPFQDVLPMHCSANIGKDGDVALFFGLSGTGKTTLSADPDRRLIGDDEHAWTDTGVFNIEGGCYAKTIRLSPLGEPQIWNALHFGSVLENVPVDPQTHEPDFASDRYTENTRAAYPISHIPNCETSGLGSHPRNVFFLTCDAFGVLPPLARLTPEQAVQYFLIGYTAKVAGTEAGVLTPTPEFSTAFAKPFLPLPPRRYAAMLQEKLTKHRVPVWLVNTGWTGGAVGIGRRMALPNTRNLLRAALTGALDDVPFTNDPIFGLSIPTRCPTVPTEMLQPRRTWPDPEAYDAQAQKLAEQFRQITRSLG